MTRYDFDKGGGYDELQLRDELRAAGLPCDSVGGNGGAVVVLLSEDAPDALTRCAAVVDAHTPRTPQQRLNQQALATIFGGAEPLHVALRSIFGDIYTQINDLRELHGLPRILEPEIMARLVAGLGG